MISKYVIFEYEIIKKDFLEKVRQGYRINEIEKLRDCGFTDDDIFISHLVGLYKAIYRVD